jgi:hypothetical protein
VKSNLEISAHIADLYAAIWQPCRCNGTEHDRDCVIHQMRLQGAYEALLWAVDAPTTYGESLREQLRPAYERGCDNVPFRKWEGAMRDEREVQSHLADLGALVYLSSNLAHGLGDDELRLAAAIHLALAWAAGDDNEYQERVDGLRAEFDRAGITRDRDVLDRLLERRG